MSTYINKNGQQSGPFSDEQIVEGLKNNIYSPNDLCWREGWEAWKKLGNVYAVAKNNVHREFAKPDGTVSNFERGIFGFTRWFVGAIALGVVTTIVILGIVIVMPISGTKVSLKETNGEEDISNSGYNPANSIISNVLGSGGNQGVKVRIPENVKSAFDTEKDKEVLQSWIENYTPSQQQDFLDNLSQVLSDYMDNHKNISGEDFSKLVNNYHRVKSQKIMSSEMMKNISLGVKAGAAVLIFLLILVLCIVSLILVLLAIERNTRGKI